MDSANSCSDCSKVLHNFRKALTCALCKSDFCKIHRKNGTKGEIICSACFKLILRKRFLKENSTELIGLGKDLKKLNSKKEVAKIRLEKKERSIKALQTQLKSLRSQHLIAIKSIRERIEKASASNLALEGAKKCLKNALSEMKLSQLISQERSQASSSELDCNMQDKKNFQNDILILSKMHNKLIASSNHLISLSTLKMLCCAKCYLQVAKRKRKESSRSSSIMSSASAKSSKSAKLYPSEACNCILI